MPMNKRAYDGPDLGQDDLRQLVRLVLREAQRVLSSGTGSGPCQSEGAAVTSSSTKKNNGWTRDGVNEMSVAKRQLIEEAVIDRLKSDPLTIDSPIDIDIDRLTELFAEAADDAKAELQAKGIAVSGH